MANLKGFITNLNAYNKGELIGKWLEFPIDEDELSTVLEEIGINEDNEETFFTDYECDLSCFDPSSLDEFETIEDLNEIAEKLEEISNSDLDAEVNAGIEYGMTINQAIDKALDGEIVFVDENKNGNVDQNIAEAYIDSIGGIQELSKETISRYIDFEYLGRDIRLEYYKEDESMPETAGEFWCGDESSSDEEIGESVVDQLGIDGIKDISIYFDLESFGHDIYIEGSFSITDDGIFEIIY